MVKQETLDKVDHTADSSGEAFVHAQISLAAVKTRVPNVVHFKGARDYSETKDRRYYLEYCPYGDLSSLRERYRLWR